LKFRNEELIPFYMAEKKNSEQIPGSKRAGVGPPSDHNFPDREEIQVWLTATISRIIKIPSAQIDARRSFAEYGMDSLALVELSGTLGDFMNRDLSEVIAWEYPTIELLAAHLAEENNSTRSEPAD
jgi:acyl carrier protein